MVLDGPRRLSVRDVELDPLPVDQARIRVAVAGVCGSDVHGFAGLNARRPPGVVMGHEVGGTVVAAGAEASVDVGDFVVVNPIMACGDCAACRAGKENLCEKRRLYGCAVELCGGFADFMDVQADNLVAFSDRVPREWAALVEPLCVGFHAVGRVRGSASRGALVVGAGPIGLACALAARDAGMEAVLSEPLEERRQLARKLGFEAGAPAAITQSQQHFDLVFECVGLKSTMSDAVSLTAGGGTIVCVGMADPMLAISSTALVIEERSLVGSSAYTGSDFSVTAAWAGSGKVDLSPMITARQAISDLPGVFDALATGRTPTGKTVMVEAERRDRSDRSGPNQAAALAAADHARSAVPR